MIVRGMSDVRFNSEKNFKVSMTGVTHSLEYGYRNRHITGPGHQSLPNGDICRKPIIKKTHALEKKGRAAAVVDPGIAIVDNNSAGSMPDGLPERPPFDGYTLKKPVIRNRILNYTNVMLTDRRWKNPVLFFWTVTFPEGTTDDICYRLFNTWLTTLRQKKMLRSYLWVAERQPKKTKVIHFHIFVPHFMNVKRANAFMRESICGLIKKGELPNWNLHAAKRYNGVDIAKDRKTKKVINFAQICKRRSLARYLTKYVTKNETKLYRLPWHCSRDWSAMIVGVALTRAEIGRVVTDGKMLDGNPIKNVYCNFYRWAKSPPERVSNYLGWMNYAMLEHFFGMAPTDYFSKN